MDNEMMYQMFLSTLAKMNDTDLENALKKAKELLSENDYHTLQTMIQKEKNRS